MKRIINAICLAALVAFAWAAAEAAPKSTPKGERAGREVAAQAGEKKGTKNTEKGKVVDKKGAEKNGLGKKSAKGKVKPPEEPQEQRMDDANVKINVTNFAPKRTKPVFTGPFQVDVILISFPDCTPPSVESVVKDLDHLKGGSYTIKDYYDDYSQDTTYPVLSGYPYVYEAPEPLGHYCKEDPLRNRIGWTDPADGEARGEQLRQDAVNAILKNTKGYKKGPVSCFVFCTKLDKSKVEQLLRPHYPKPEEEWMVDPLTKYDPEIRWQDPLWPCSRPQVIWPADGSTLVHELGHVLGAPDYYHAPENHDGILGDPALPWSHGPTGLAYDRVIYQAFVPPETYPTIKEDGVYTLDPRQSRIAKVSGGSEPTLGYFIPSSHPHYMFYVEYVYKEKLPVGTPGAQGLLVHVINVTFSHPLMGPPDLCYTYRKGDKFLKGLGKGTAYLRTGDSFTMETDPQAIVPPLIPGGIEITEIKEEDGKCSFKLTFTKPKLTPKDLRDCLLPKIELLDVVQVMPNSMRPVCDFLYRGEPLMDEYGFVWDVKPNPTVTKSNRFPLYHRDRWDARIIDLKPDTTYYVRAYVKNANGLTYSKTEKEVKTPKSVDVVPPLITDRMRGAEYLTKHYQGYNVEDLYYNSANAILSLMSLGVYYSTEIGGDGKKHKPGAKNGFDIYQVHTTPTDRKPPFRLKMFDEFHKISKATANRLGLFDKEFKSVPEWIKKISKELKIKDPKKVFVHVKTADDFLAQKPLIKEWLDKSQPVMLIRENDFMPNVTHEIFPLDIVFIDGYNAAGDLHVSYPLGCDRDTRTVSGIHSANDIYISVKDAVLMFYRPDQK